mgnify:CR=1 FL=1
MEDIPLPLGLAMILGIIIKVALDRFDRVDGSAMTEDGVARSKPPQYQLLGGGGVLFIGLVALWLGCRRWINPSFSDDDAGVATIWLIIAVPLLILGTGVILQTNVNYIEVGPGYIEKHSFLDGTTRIEFEDIESYLYSHKYLYSHNYLSNLWRADSLVILSSDRRRIKFSPEGFKGEHVTSVIAFRLLENRWPSLLDEFDRLAVMEAAADGSGKSYLRRVSGARLEAT